MNVIDKFLNETLVFQSKVGNFSNYIIKVNSNDNGKIPHFHLVDSTTQGNLFHTCIQLEKNNYFLHEGKMDILSSVSDRKKLNEFMCKEPVSVPKEVKKYKDYITSNWLLTCFLWNVQNERGRFIDLLKTKQPNYTTINQKR